MYIAPQGTIKLLTGVPLEPSYDHTIYFDTLAAQQTYFESKVKNGCTFTNQYYTRKGRNVLRVQKNVESLYDINYMMFKNDGFLPVGQTAKWFYCFVTDVEYVNNEVTDVYYMVDIMQTWFFDYTLEQCFVDREHSATDNLWENTIPENIEFGEHELTELPRPRAQIYPSGLDGDLFDEFAIIVCSSAEEVGGQIVDATGGLYNGIYGGLQCEAFPFQSVQAINDYLTALTNAAKSDSITNIFMMPVAFVATKMNNYEPPREYSVNFQKHTSLGYSLNGSYKEIKNKKLLNYPYNYLYVVSGIGDSADFKFEYFSDENNCTFKAIGTGGCDCQIALIPNNYLKSMFTSAQNELNYNEAIYTGDFPQCSWNIDTFRAWIAQNKIKIGATIAKAAGMTAIPAIAGAAAGAGVIAGGGTAQVAVSAADATAKNVTDVVFKAGGSSLINEVKNLVIGGAEAYIAPDRNHGVNQTSLGLSTKSLCYKFYYARIRPEYIEKIDSYFNRFGYKCNMTKVPNTNVRPHWTYTKTVGCTITGTLPAATAQSICNIYNNGITFWKKPSEVGHYELDNRPLSAQPIAGAGEVGSASIG